MLAIHDDGPKLCDGVGAGSLRLPDLFEAESWTYNPVPRL
jgi:hypothetical protein